jgi:hypothetical protein
MALRNTSDPEDWRQMPTSNIWIRLPKSGITPQQLVLLSLPAPIFDGTEV